MLKNISFEETGVNLRQKLVCLDNHGENNSNKIRKSSETGQD